MTHGPRPTRLTPLLRHHCRYLRAEVEELEDEDAGEDTAAAEAEARKVFEEMVDTQARLGEEPRFTEAVKGTVNFGRGSGTEDTGLWGCVVLWQQFLEQRSNVVGNKMQREVRRTAWRPLALTSRTYHRDGRVT